MPAPDQPATPDDLATLYLRARDVPCPGCGYNRRDGAAAECPECGHALRLETTARRPLELRAADCYLLAGGMILVAAIFVPNVMIDFLQANGFGRLMLGEAWVIQSVSASLGFFVSGVASLLAIRRVRRRRPGAARTIAFAAGAFIAAFAVPAVLMLLDLF